MTESAIERQVAKSLPQGLLALREAIRGSTTYPSIFSLSKLYFCFLECVLWYQLSHTLEPWYVTVHLCLLTPVLKLRNRYPASRKWYVSTSNVGLESVRLSTSPDQTKDFVKFLGIVIIFFCGFLTTFTMLAQGDFTPGQVLWIMLNVCLPNLRSQNQS